MMINRGNDRPAWIVAILGRMQAWVCQGIVISLYNSCRARMGIERGVSTKRRSGWPGTPFIDRFGCL